jgi:hypothetical protein
MFQNFVSKLILYVYQNVECNFKKNYPQNNTKCIKKKYIFLLKWPLHSVHSPIIPTIEKKKLSQFDYLVWVIAH